MDFSKIAFFNMAKKRMAWLTQRQEILAQNIANSDTPNYKPRDLKKFDFQKLVTHEVRQVNMTVTRPGHLQGRRRSLSEFSAEETRKPFETSPSGNAVILEEQLMKVNETTMAHRLATELYRKNLGMFRIAIGRGGG